MNLAHVHLLLNHFPTIGFSIGLVLFLISLVGKHEHLKQICLGIFFVISLLSIPTYLSGNAAQREICPPVSETLERCVPGVSGAVVGAHEDAALLAFVFMEITGFVAWIGLWEFRRIAHASRWSVAAVLILSVVTFGLMARAANLGGDIHHSEIRSGPEEAATEIRVTNGAARAIGSFVLAKPWVWPASETLHFVGLCLLFTVVLLVDLRMLGMAKSVSFAAVYQLLPLGILGFAINLVTGMLFFLAAPQQYTSNNSFYMKIILVVLAGINSMYFMLFDQAWAVGPGDDAPLTAKLVAASAICLWVGVLFYGHMLPFLGNAF